METDQDGELVILHFGSIDAANHALATLNTLAAEGFVTLVDAAVISRGDGGTVTVSSEGHKLGTTSVGGVLGLVAGGILGLPILGMLAGAGLANKKGSHDRILELVASADRNLVPGSAIVALLVRGLSDPATVADRFQIHRTDILSVEIPPDLQAALDQARS